MDIYSGVLLFLTVLGFGVWGFIGKIGMEALGRNQYLFLSYLIVIIIFGLLFVLNRGTMVLSKNLIFPILGGVFTALAIASFFIVIERIPLSIATPISSVYPVLSVVLAIIFLGEKLTSLQAIGATLAIFGVMLLSIS